MKGAYFILFVFFALHTCDCCPHGYTLHKTSCYRVSHDAKSWSDAMAACKHDGGYLAEISSAEENKFLEDLTKQAEGQKYAWYAVYYIGGSNVDGQWQWMRQTGPLTYSNWRQSAPNNVRGCLVINTNDGKWNHLGCNSHTGYICESGA